MLLLSKIYVRNAVYTKLEVKTYTHKKKRNNNPTLYTVESLKSRKQTQKHSPKGTKIFFLLHISSSIKLISLHELLNIFFYFTKKKKTVIFSSFRFGTKREKKIILFFFFYSSSAFIMYECI